MWFSSSPKEETAPAPVAETNRSHPVAAPSVLPAGFDASKLHPMAGLGSGGLEYLDLESNSQRADGLIASRGWTEDLSYGTGAVYLVGLSVGGLYGLAEGMRKSADMGSAKLRLNTVLNSVTRRGPYLGNTSGVLAILYNVINSSIDYARGGTHEDANSLAAGAITGALFRLSKGVRPMLISSALLTGVAGGWCVLKRMVAPGEEKR